MCKKLRASGATDGNCDAVWVDIRDTVLEAAAETVGHREKRNKDWFDDNDEIINELLAQRHSSHAEHIADPTNMIKRSRYLKL